MPNCAQILNRETQNYYKSTRRNQPDNENECFTLITTVFQVYRVYQFYWTETSDYQKIADLSKSN